MRGSPNLLRLDIGPAPKVTRKPAAAKPCAGGCGAKIKGRRRKYCPKCANNHRHPEGWSGDHSKAQQFKKDYCEACGTQEGKLHGHHCDGDPSNNVADNIQTLCVWCHNFLHATAKRLGWKVPGRMPTFVRELG